MSVQEGAHSKDDYGLCFFALSLFLGLCVKICLRNFPRLKIPYAVVLLILGSIIGILDHFYNLGFIGSSISTWRNVGGRALILIFLPPLLFCSSSTVDWHIFRRLLGQACLLAGPGVLLSALLTSTALMYFIPSEFNFTEAMLFGSLLSATDPVAVVALLKELGAPETLGVLIEGESLLNDGVAYALFVQFLLQLTSLHPYTGVEMAGWSIYALVISTVIGVVGGYLSMFSIGYIWNDPKLEVCVSIMMAWTVFLVGDVAKASGVLSVVAFGLTFASLSMSYLSQEVRHSMTEVWHMLEYIAETLVFVYSGVLCADEFVNNRFLDLEHVLGLLLLYITLNVIRFIVIGVFWYPLTKIGYGMDWKRGLLISWSGLRGAVGLVGVIEIAEQKTCPEGQTSGCVRAGLQESAMFYMAGIVVMTICINGVSTQWLVSRLGVTRRSDTAKKNYDASISRINHIIEDQILALNGNSDLRGSDMNVVWSYMPCFNTETLAYRESKHGVYVEPVVMNAEKNKLDKVANCMFRTCTTVSNEEILQESRYRFLNFVKASYHHQFEYGMCGSWPSLRILNESASLSQDNACDPLNEWEGYLVWYCSIHNWREQCFRGSVPNHIVARGYDIAFSFIKAHEYAESKLGQLELPSHIQQAIILESEVMRNAARMFLHDVHNSYEEIASSIKTGMVISQTLRHAYKEAQRMYHSAEIEEHDFDFIKKEFEKKILCVKRALGYVAVRNSKDLFRALPFFSGVDEATFKLVEKHANLKKFDHGERIMERGGKHEHMYLIIRGRVSFSIVRRPTQHLKQHKKRGESTDDDSGDTGNSSDNGGLGRRSTYDSWFVPSRKSRKHKSHPTRCFGHRLCPQHQEEGVILNDEELLNEEEDEGKQSSSFEVNTDELEIVRYTYGRGETVGDLEALSDTPVVTTVTCESIVEAYEINTTWLLSYFDTHPNHILETNLLCHAALVALESFFPQLASCPVSIRPWITRKLIVKRPPSDEPFQALEEGGIAVILRGCLHTIGGKRLIDPVVAITVFDIPHNLQIYGEDSVLVCLPTSATSLLQENSAVDTSEYTTGTKKNKCRMVRSGSSNTLNRSIETEIVSDDSTINAIKASSMSDIQLRIV